MTISWASGKAMASTSLARIVLDRSGFKTDHQPAAACGFALELAGFRSSVNAGPMSNSRRKDSSNQRLAAIDRPMLSVTQPTNPAKVQGLGVSGGAILLAKSGEKRLKIRELIHFPPKLSEL